MLTSFLKLPELETTHPQSKPHTAEKFPDVLRQSMVDEIKVAQFTANGGDDQLWIFKPI